MVLRTNKNKANHGLQGGHKGKDKNAGGEKKNTHALRRTGTRGRMGDQWNRAKGKSRDRIGSKKFKDECELGSPKGTGSNIFPGGQTRGREDGRSRKAPIRPGGNSRRDGVLGESLNKKEVWVENNDFKSDRQQKKTKLKRAPRRTKDGKT